MRLYISPGTLASAGVIFSLVLSLNLNMQQDLPQKTVSMTFYGYPDNCDSTGCYGSEVAKNCENPDGRSRNFKAGGDGSWNNPLSMVGNFKACSIVYLPYLRKYGIIDDICPNCGEDQMDIWVESKCSDDYGAICDCEYSLTPDDEQIVYYNISANQGSKLLVSKGPLYDGATQKCFDKVYGVSPSNMGTSKHKLMRRVCGNDCACKSC